jgi:CheY-like chemotaxis protein
VELPGAVAAVAAPVPAAVGPAHALSVLVIDDELHIRHYMEATLSAWGHAVTLAPDGAAGLAATRARAFDLIICDIRMPELGGREFYERLLAEQPASAERVVFATGDTIRGDTLAFLEARGTAWLTKPFGLSELRQILAAARPR